MNALDAASRQTELADQRQALDADAWFTALDNRVLQVGTDTCIAQVLGIHISPTGLWLQLSCADEADRSVVVQVTAATRVEDVLNRLRRDPPTGSPLEILDCSKTATPDLGARHLAMTERRQSARTRRAL
jgi:hypothetical protein